MHTHIAPPRPSFRHVPRARFARHFLVATGVLALALLPSVARSADPLRPPKRTLFAPPPRPPIVDDAPTPAATPAASPAPLAATPTPTPAPPISTLPPLNSIPPLSTAPPIPTAPAAARVPLPPPPPEPVAPLPATFAPLPALTPSPAPDEPIFPEKVVPVPHAAAPAVAYPAAKPSAPSAPPAPLTLVALAAPPPPPPAPAPAPASAVPAGPAPPSVAPAAPPVTHTAPTASPNHPFAQSPGHPTATVPDEYDFKIKAATDSNNVPFHLEALVKSSTNLVSKADALRQSLKQRQLADYQTQLDLARQCRREKNLPRAINLLIELVEGDAPAGFKRPALYELALAHHEDRQLVRAQQIFAQYLKLYDDDPMTPEIFLRQGMIFREMGVSTLAIGKFYAVMTSALNLQQDKIDYYKTLVLHAQTEIADTYFQQASFTQAADFYQRLLKLSGTELNRPQIQFKLIRSLAQLERHLEAIGQGKALVSRHPDAPEVPETRYQIAMSLKALNRNSEALQEVLALLQTQQSVAANDPANWAYWQQRTGNEIANHFYKENDNLNALVIYQNLAPISPAAAWQLPAWYQTALVYERLRQPQQALETYARILQRSPEADPKTNPGLAAVVAMARWRKDYLTWHGVADTRTAALRAPALVVRPFPTEPISVGTFPPADALTPLATPTFSPIGSPGSAPIPAPAPAPKNNPPLTPPK